MSDRDDRAHIRLSGDVLGRPSRFEIVEGDRFRSTLPINDEQGIVLLELLSDRFPDWLARVKREAAAEALADAAVSIEPFSGIGLANGASRADVATWLRARAAEYRAGEERNHG